MDGSIIERQKKLIERGSKELKIIAPCTVGNGIVKLSDPEKAFHIKNFEEENKHYEMTFFVPASGSGSRMFGFLTQFLEESSPNEEIQRKVHKFVDALTVMPFYSKIKQALDIDSLDYQSEEDVKKIIHYILDEKGLNLSHYPKALIPFHLYEDGEVRTPIEEHIIQNIEAIGGRSHHLKLHFTIQNKYKAQIQQTVDHLLEKNEYSCKVDYSEQKSSTDALAFHKGEPLKVRDQYVYRPSGHGALLENINALDASIVFLRNIDNIPHQDQAKKSIETKKVLGSFLFEKVSEMHRFLKDIEADKVNELELKAWIRKNLEISDYPKDKEAFMRFAFELLNRPVRVCGMVKNTGQPGGGPFWVQLENGKVSKQIVEKAQLNLENAQQKSLFEKSTHFNPVDIACSIRNYKNEKFDLSEFVDQEQYFIVHKTHDGKSVEYVERPGLWNGSMAHWITFFVETSNNSFCPVKTVLDLLTPQHLS